MVFVTHLWDSFHRVQESGCNLVVISQNNLKLLKALMSTCKMLWHGIPLFVRFKYWSLPLFVLVLFTLRNENVSSYFIVFIIQ